MGFEMLPSILASVSTSALASWLSWMAVSAAPTAASGTAILYRPELAAHRSLVETLTQADRSFVALPVTEAWPEPHPPKQVVALGDAATRSAADRWPGRRTAEALVVVPNPEAILSITAATSAACTAQQVQREGAWMILAAPEDTRAPALAKALGGELRTGTPRELQAALRSERPDNVWLRAHPSVSSDAWFRYLGLLHRGGTYVASDATGLRRYGVEAPVESDTQAIAQRLLRWAQPARRKAAKRGETSSIEGAPCRPAPSDPPRD